MKGAEKIEIDRRYCKGCMLCKYICPRGVYAVGTERSDLDYLMPKPAQVDNCIVCRLCEQHCPDMVITVTGKEKS